LPTRAAAIHSTVATIFRDHVPATTLAMACHSETCTFIKEFFTFLSGFYDELIHTLRSGPVEAWLLTASMGRAVFEELRVARVSVDDPGSDLPASMICAMYIYGTIKALAVQRNFSKADFHHHPCLAPVLNHHIFKTRVPLSMFTELTTSMAKLNKQMADMQCVIDRQACQITAGGKQLVNKKGNKRTEANDDDESQAWATSSAVCLDYVPKHKISTPLSYVVPPSACSYAAYGLGTGQFTQSTSLSGIHGCVSALEWPFWAFGLQACGFSVIFISLKVGTWRDLVAKIFPNTSVCLAGTKPISSTQCMLLAVDRVAPLSWEYWTWLTLKWVLSGHSGCG
jgi:hypothetical protein